MLKKSLMTYLLAFLLLPMMVNAAECKAPTCHSVVSAKDNYRIELQAASAIPVNSLFNLDVTVTTKEGKPLAGKVSLDLDAGMPHHNHGMNVKPVIKELGAGKFLVEGMMFHMPGAWTITMSVSKGIMREAANLVVEVQ